MEITHNTIEYAASQQNFYLNKADITFAWLFEKGEPVETIEEEHPRDIDLWIKFLKQLRGIEDDAFTDGIYTCGEMAKMEIAERESILHPWFLEESIHLICGERGCGKTWFGLSLADAVSRGTALGPWQCKKQMKVLYLDGELPLKSLNKKRELLDVSPEVILFSEAVSTRAGNEGARLQNPEWSAKMTRTLRKNKVGLWIIDNLASLCPGINENDSGEWSLINRWLIDLRAEGINTVMIHHTNKKGKQRGTHAREDNVDSSIMLVHPPGYNAEGGAKFVAKFSKNRAEKDLNLITDTEFKLVYEDGKLTWNWHNAKQSKNNEYMDTLQRLS